MVVLILFIVMLLCLAVLCGFMSIEAYKSNVYLTCVLFAAVSGYSVFLIIETIYRLISGWGA